MATTKTRINISIPKPVRDALKNRARARQEPVATTAARLLEEMLEIEEDIVLGEIAEHRLEDGGKLVKNSPSLWK